VLGIAGLVEEFHIPDCGLVVSMSVLDRVFEGIVEEVGACRVGLVGAEGVAQVVKLVPQRNQGRLCRPVP